jgi:hypothetical protein
MTSPLIRVEEEMVNVRKEAAAMAAGILDIDDEKLRSPSGFLLMEGMASALAGCGKSRIEAASVRYV